MPLPEPPGLIPRKGYIYVVIAALLWAGSGAAGKFLFNRGVTPLELVQLRVTLSTLCLLMFLLALKPRLLLISRKDFLYFAVLGITGMAMVQFTYLYTISRINVAVAVLLEYLAPIFIACWYAFAAPEKLTRKTLAGVVLSVAGCYLAVGAYNVDLLSQNRVGIMVGITAGLSYGWYAIYSERGMCRYDPWTVVFYALAFAALFWNIAMPPLGAFTRPYNVVEWCWLLYIVIFGTVVPFGFYSVGISMVRSTRASVAATLEPIAAGFLAFFFLGETLAPLQIIGGMLVIASVILLQITPECDPTTASILRQNSKEQIPG